ncbi:glucose-6-phosphate dehydrogenase assembly protein OpcA [Nocardioides sp.]|uniref:glucose-6-phosphate dehydrogenase assembly protein OpcA n=1 Tax=Nocardioides sp. TaxID=35761 RepID=UPI003515D4F2
MSTPAGTTTSRLTALDDTSAAAIASALRAARKEAGSPAMGMVLTLVVVVPEADAERALECARRASLAHPARVLAIVEGARRGHGRVDARVGVGDGWSGEIAILTLHGEVVDHADSLVLPLLLPDSPVAVWWPTRTPEDPASDPVGRLAGRRITDVLAAPRGRRTLLERVATHYAPGNTDLSWARITSWRAVLAAALDQAPGAVRGGHVVAERVSPGADLLVAWLSARLGVEIDRRTSSGPGVTEVCLDTASGPLVLARTDGRLATLTIPGRGERRLALPRREVPDLLMEELRRLDEDEIFAEVSARIADDAGGAA